MALPIPFAIMPIIGLILGIVYKSKKYPVAKGVSTAGIILNSIALVITIVGIILSAFFLVGMAEAFENYDYGDYSDYSDYYEYFDDYSF
jgi:hypothetical protein